MSTTPALPDGFQVRPVTLDDLEAVWQVQVAQERADFGQSFADQDALRRVWDSPQCTLHRDTWVVVAPEGHVVSYAQVLERGPGRLLIQVSVLPPFLGRGIGRHLFSLARQRAFERAASAPADVRITVGATWISERNQTAQHILERAGYPRVRSFASMQLDLDALPPSPIWNSGIVARPFQVGVDEQAAYAADEEIARDERGHTRLPLEEWRQQNLADPAAVFMACAGDEIAGLIIGEAAGQDGWVWHLGVRRAWRKQGLGMALLRLEQGEFYRRGLRTMKLNVDTLSLTQAYRLYERAGMQTVFRYHVYEKVVREMGHWQAGATNG
jgi:GNAT superfamily N-acetyltransferase